MLKGDEYMQIQIMVNEQEYELLNISPLISPNTRIYNICHDLNVKVGDKLIVSSDKEDMFTIVSDIEYGDGTIWYKIIE